MKSARRIVALVIALAIGVFAVHRTHLPLRATGAMPQQAYIWHRSWTPVVRDAVINSAPAFSAYSVLGAEASFRSGNDDVARVALDYTALKSANIPVSVALRIGPYHGSFATDDSTANKLGDLAASLLADVKKGGIQLIELQLDFDCAESKLGGYTLWVDGIKKRVSPVPVTITALPSWLANAQFPALARAAGGYVLQVHSLQRPGSSNSPMTLCDPNAAKSAVELGGRIGVPFRVALPTYGYLVAFDENGIFKGLSAEAQAMDWPAGSTVKLLSANPADMAGLIRDWTADRPRCMTGIIWYRLPTSDDALNWKWSTLQAVTEGRTPGANLMAIIGKSEPGLYEVELYNAGDADASLNALVTARWDEAELAAADALGGFEMTQQSGRIVIRPSAANALDRLGPGERRTIAWLRLSRDKEVHADVSQIAP